MDARTDFARTSALRRTMLAGGIVRCCALIVLAAIWLFAELCFFLGYPTPVVQMVAATVMVQIPAYWIGIFTLSVLNRDWTSITVGVATAIPSIALAVGVWTLPLRDIRFWALSPYYLYEVSRATPGPDGRRAVSFPIGTVHGFLSPSYLLSVEYDEGDDFSNLREECDRWARRHCPVYVERLHGSYYFKRVMF
ncbi:MAG: hypothetical protein JNL07_09250 [Rhodospirillales bacterium]|nr:hypothetical protein [Rhodospirillales bacterium]